MWLHQTITALTGVFCTLASADQLVLGVHPEERKTPANVAIIGAGAAGSSSAYHLAQYANEAAFPVNITIFETNPYIGGRSTTVDAYNDSSLPLELGGSIFVEINHVLVDAVKAFNLSTSVSDFKLSRAGVPGPALAVWDGHKFVITQNSEGSWWDIAKLFYKYGLAPYRTMNLMKTVVGKFLKMYEQPIFPFASLTKVAQDLELLAVTASTGEQYLRENNIGTSFARDIIQASTRVNYAQNLPYIHGLETMVCMAANGAMTVEGGNWQIFAEMIGASHATTHLQTKVAALEKQQDGSYTITSKQHNDEEDIAGRTSSFDEVILAAPYQYANIDLDSASAHKPDEIPYVQLHVTVFTSSHLLSPAFFDMPADQPVPHVIITTLPSGETPPSGPEGVGSPGFFSISLLDTITNPRTGGQEYAYKIFSPEPPNSTFFSRLLGIELDDGEVSEKDVTWMFRKLWNSYPYELPRVTFERIKLDDGLWYTSAIESFISTMETSAFMGKNVARLMVDEWMAKADQ